MSLQRALAAAARTRCVVAGMSITYKRGKHQVAIVATLGQSTFEGVDGDGGPLSIQTRDFLFPAERLVINSKRVEPQRGDLIEQTIGAQSFVYEVLPPADAEQCFRYTDPFHGELRVHTQRKK